MATPASTPPALPDAPAEQSLAVVSRSQVVRPGRLPVSELAYDRPAAASPFGDDFQFPLPVESLTYLHPQPESESEAHGH